MITALILLALVGAAVSAPSGLLASAVSAQHHSQDELGQYAYGYTNPLSAKEEVKTVDGITRGGYSYLDAHGLVQSVNYVSDDVNGFRVAATNLPAGPVAPAAPVEDEPVVAQVKAIEAVNDLSRPIVVAPLPQVAVKEAPAVLIPAPSPSPIPVQTAHVIAEEPIITNTAAPLPNAPAYVVPAAPAVPSPVYNTAVLTPVTPAPPAVIAVPNLPAPVYEPVAIAPAPPALSLSAPVLPEPALPAPVLPQHPLPAPALPKVAAEVPATAVVSAPVVASEISAQHHSQDELGQYSYGYVNPLSAKEEVKTADGVTRGGYSYLDSHGLIQNVNYVSDDVNGFRVAASNIPQQVAPVDIPDSPDVAEAKAQFFAVIDEAKAAVGH